MDKAAILKGFDDYAGAKKNSSLYMRLMFLYTIVVTVANMVWSYAVVTNAQSKIKVVTKSGQYLQTTLSNQEKLFNTLIKNHCANAVEYANSFDRLTIKENQIKAIFLINKSDALRIFAKYNTQRSYGDALDRGLVYKAVFQKLDALQGVEGENEPYHVKFTSLLQIKDNDKPVAEYIITSEGDIISYTSQYPENVSGFYFKKYTQSWKPKNLSNE